MYKSDYGKIKFKLTERMAEQELSKNRLSVISGVRFDTIQRYCRGDLVKLDLDVLCRLCQALDCEIEDIIEYIPN